MSWGPVLRATLCGARRRVRAAEQVLVLGDELAGHERGALRVCDHGHPHPGGVERPGQNLAAELNGAPRRSRPRRRRRTSRSSARASRASSSAIGLIAATTSMKPLGRAHLSPSAREGPECQLLEVSRRSPAASTSAPPCRASVLPSEHRAVEGLRTFGVTRGEPVEVGRTVFVDDLRALVVLGLPHARDSTLGVGEDRHPSHVEHVARLREHRAAGRARLGAPSRRRCRPRRRCLFSAIAWGLARSRDPSTATSPPRMRPM